MKRYRIEIATKQVQQFSKAKVYLLESEEINEEIFNTIAHEVLGSTISEDIITNHAQSNYKFYLDKNYKFGVTDNLANSVSECIHEKFGINIQVHTGEIFYSDKKFESSNFIDYGNHLLNNFSTGPTTSKDYETRFTDYNKSESVQNEIKINQYDCQLSDEEFLQLSQDNCWALNLNEIQILKKYFLSDETRKKFLNNPTDLEVEIIAQTWSEHCKHKIFSSSIHYTESDDTPLKIGEMKLTSLFKDKIKKASYDLIERDKLDWCKSLFHDNAGIVRFDKFLDICAKVETHNSPSALDPYGGALTGILGLNRDILGCGLGAMPIANTNVFCVGSEKNIESLDLPKSLMNPKKILDGVHQGVKDGGNKSGIPTVNGAIVFDDNFMGKPLVYCGTIGVIPHKVGQHESFEKPYNVGDLIYMVGGRVGLDGIHGATFSSLELDESSPSSAVQIGDPFTQKRVMDFILDARDQQLYTGITDNGAGGLSSSVGEMAQTTDGAIIDLANVPLKYPGLQPFQIMISESQERMTLAVNSNKKKEFEQLAKKYNVEVSHIGEFTNSGYLHITYKEKICAYINLDFLHNQDIDLKLKGHYTPQFERSFWHGKDLRTTIPSELSKIIKDILSTPNVRSKKQYISQYDQEVKSSTLLKTFDGKKYNTPNDASVVWLAQYGGEEDNAISISCGLTPKLSYFDTYLMAKHSVDEAIRNLISVGVDPEHMAILDNFCWADPIESPKNPQAQYRTAQLVRACEGLYQAAMDYSTPLISGKDSMKNNFYDESTNTSIAIEPTLLITAIGKTNLANIQSASFKNPGEDIYLVTPYELDNIFKEVHISELTYLYKFQNSTPAPIDTKLNSIFYKKVHSLIKDNIFSSIHDISDGGLITSICESTFGNQIGCKLIDQNFDHLAYLFNELSGSFIISAKKEFFDTLSQYSEFHKIGETISNYNLEINNQKIDLQELEALWSSDNEF